MKVRIKMEAVNWLLTRSRTFMAKDDSSLTLSVNKGGTINVNKAFVEKYYKAHPKHLYFQIGWVEDDYYLFISRVKQEGFYAFNALPKNTGYSGTAMEARKALGSKKARVKYRLVPAKLEGASHRCFKIEALTPAE